MPAKFKKTEVVLSVGKEKFTEAQVDCIIKYVTTGWSFSDNNKGSTLSSICAKLVRLYPEYSTLPPYKLIFKFAYKEGLVKL